MPATQIRICLAGMLQAELQSWGGGALRASGGGGSSGDMSMQKWSASRRPQVVPTKYHARYVVRVPQMVPPTLWRPFGSCFGPLGCLFWAFGGLLGASWGLLGGRGGRPRGPPVFEGFRRFSVVFGNLRGPLGIPGGPRRLPRGSQRSPEIFDFSSIFRRRRRWGGEKYTDEKNMHGERTSERW